MVWKNCFIISGFFLFCFFYGLFGFCFGFGFCLVWFVFFRFFVFLIFSTTVALHMASFCLYQEKLVLVAYLLSVFLVLCLHGTIAIWRSSKDAVF